MGGHPVAHLCNRPEPQEVSEAGGGVELVFPLTGSNSSVHGKLPRFPDWLALPERENRSRAAQLLTFGFLTNNSVAVQTFREHVAGDISPAMRF